MIKHKLYTDKEEKMGKGKIERGEAKWEEMVVKLEIDESYFTFGESMFLCLAEGCEKFARDMGKFCTRCGEPTLDNLLEVRIASDPHVMEAKEEYFYCPGCEKEVKEPGKKDNFCQECGKKPEVRFRSKKL